MNENDRRLNREMNAFLFGWCLIGVSTMLIGIGWALHSQDWTNVWPSYIGVAMLIITGFAG